MTHTSDNPRALQLSPGGSGAPGNRYGYEATRNLLTYGTWPTEAASVAAFDQVVNEVGHFMIYREIRGTYLAPKLDQEVKQPRIDRILVPKPSLIQAGWRHGPIGVECKRSGEKIGRPIAQMLDYSRATWLIEPAKGLWVMLQWVFLWPLEKTSGPIASILAQHRAGSAETTSYELLRFDSGESRVAAFERSGNIRLGRADNGRKAGAR